MNGCSKIQAPAQDSRLRMAEIDLPSVTVIVTSYNYDKYIVPCLKSIARQTYPRYNCIIVDDCSTDGSVKLIKEFIVSDAAQHKFSLVIHDKNAGQMAAFKTGVQHSDGVFVAFVDADDILFDDFLATHIEAHMGPKVIAFTSANQYQINENNEIVAGVHPDLFLSEGHQYIKCQSIHHPYWVWATTSSMMFRKAVLDLILPDDTEDFKICADNYTCHFANLLGGSMLIPTVHGCYRRHGANGFSLNPIVGGQLPTGNMALHPKHHKVRQLILSHLLKYHDKFHGLLSENQYIFVLLRASVPMEIITHRKLFRPYFNENKPVFIVWFFFLSCMMRIKIQLRTYYFRIRYAFNKDERNNPHI